MKRFLLFFAGLVCVLFSAQITSAQINWNLRGNHSVTVGATVGGGNILNISGYASPNASVVLLDNNGNFLRSTTADNRGNFSFSGISIFDSPATYCFRVQDFQRIGESEGCIDITPTGMVTDITEVFLPPTIGVENDTINEGEDAVIRGYTMPGATVTIKLDNSTTFTVTGDENGYYEYRVPSLSAGTYSFVASAAYNNEPSLEPRTAVEIRALSLPQQITDAGKKTIKTVQEEAQKAFNWALFFPLLLLLLLLIIAILLLILKPLWRARLLAVISELPQYVKKKKRMHHDWMLEEKKFNL